MRVRHRACLARLASFSIAKTYASESKGLTASNVVVLGLRTATHDIQP